MLGARLPASSPAQRHRLASWRSADGKLSRQQRRALSANASPSSSNNANDDIQSSRRSVLAQLVSLPTLSLVGASPALAEQATAATGSKFKKFYDPILAYQFEYPLAGDSGRPLNFLLSHPPEKYSSAAPLTADARQRIVSELFDLKQYVTVSMTVGPASGVLKGAAPASWRPRDVALTVLIDRSTARVSSGQRTTLDDVQEVHTETRDGQTYWVYEHLAQGSPNLNNTSRETYRHALAATAIRPGLDGTPYLYTLNMACPQELWADLEPMFRKGIDTFRLVATTKQYIPPDQNPWLFF